MELKNHHTHANGTVRAILNYDISTVVSHYQKEYSLSTATTQTHEIELKRFFALCVMNPATEYGMYSKDIDRLWHTFICHTVDYIEFCKKNGGKYIHHAPEDQGNASQQVHGGLSAADPFFKDYVELFGSVPPVTVWALNGDCRSPASCKKVETEIDWGIFVSQHSA